MTLAQTWYLDTFLGSGFQYLDRDECFRIWAKHFPETKDDPGYASIAESLRRGDPAAVAFADEIYIAATKQRLKA